MTEHLQIAIRKFAFATRLHHAPQQTNRDFMRELRRALQRPWSPHAPEWAVKLGSRLMGTGPSLALTGCRFAPKRFLEAGFIFQFPELPGALKNLFG
jgi:NAD dependent epimerase/dehydratase family enzyme